MKPITPLALALVTALHTSSAGEWKLTVKAGAHERSGSVVAFRTPEGLRGAAELKSEDGTVIPMQTEGARATFIEPQLAAGASKTYTLTDGATPRRVIDVEKADDVLRFAVGGKPMFTYQMRSSVVPEGVAPAYAHGAYLHPVFTPGGKLVTADYPPDHRHQRGIFFAWTKTEFEGRHPDFWNVGKGDLPDAKPMAEVRFDSVTAVADGPVYGRFFGRHHCIDHSAGSAKIVLKDDWLVRAYRVVAGGRAAHLIDLQSGQSCASESPLKLPKYHYGGLGVRGSAQWDPVNAVTMLTSNGDDRVKGDATKAKWVHMGGSVDGQLAGIAVLIAPSNFRFPQPLRLNPKNPQLCVAPSADGDWEIAPNSTYFSNYRIVTFDGPADAAWIEKLWRDYAEPATAEVATK